MVGAQFFMRSDLFFQPSCYFSSLSCTYPVTIMNWFGESIKVNLNGTNYCKQQACCLQYLFYWLQHNDLRYFSKKTAIPTKGKTCFISLMNDMRSQEPSHASFDFCITVYWLHYYNFIDFMIFYFSRHKKSFSLRVMFSNHCATNQSGEGISWSDCRTNTLVNDEKRKIQQPRIWSCLLSGTSKSENN